MLVDFRNNPYILLAGTKTLHSRPYGYDGYAIDKLIGMSGSILLLNESLESQKSTVWINHFLSFYSLLFEFEY